MGQVRRGSVRTTPAIRAAIQRSPESLQTLSNRHGIHPKTVAKWRKRPTTKDAPMGPTPVSTGRTVGHEAIVAAFGKHTLWLLDECLCALQASIPHLSRAALHRCFQRRGICRLPPSKDGPSSPKKKFNDHPIGHRRVDFAEVRIGEGRRYPFVAIDRTRKVAFAELHPSAQRVVAAEFLRWVLDKQSYRVQTVLTNNGVPFTPQSQRLPPDRHRFNRICRAHGVEHRLTKPAHS